METIELIQRLALALAIGVLVGLERGWQARQEPEGGRSVGLRTLALCGLLGGVWGAIARELGTAGAVALGFAFVILSVVIAAFRYRETLHENTFGVTTVIAAMLVFALGAFAVLGNMQVAAAAGVVVAIVLSMKSVLHEWVRRITWPELRSGLVLLAMTVVLLPLLPNRTVDPFDAVNPHELWLLTIMIAVISFVGYVALKLASERTGILLTALAGGLTSSTAVTVTLSKMARDHPDHEDALMGGILASGLMMLLRVITVVAIIQAALLPYIAVPVALAAAVLAGAAAWLLRRQTPAQQSGSRRLELGNPFELVTVLKFGLLLTVVTVLAKLATVWAGHAGAYVLAAVSGLVDVDAVTLSMARLTAGGLALSVAANAILIVTAVNTLSKAALAWTTGGATVGRTLAAISILAIGAGGLGHLLI